MNTARIRDPVLYLFRQVCYKEFEHVISKEGHEWCKCADKCVKGFEKSVECCLGVMHTSFCTFQSRSIEANVPIRQVVNEEEKAWYDSVKPIS